MKIFEVFKEQKESIENDIRTLENILSTSWPITYSDKEVLTHFHELLKKYPFNSIIMSKFLTFLQLVNDEEVIDYCTLDEIGEMHKMLAEIYDNDIDINMENYYFIHNIKDEEAKAKIFLSEFSKKVTEKLNFNNSKS